MNDPTLIGPCADYEHDLVDLQDGELAPERARDVRLHLERCARCSTWAAGFGAIDARLAAEITAPGLPPDFDARLRERIASQRRLPDAGDLRSRLEREHAALVQSLRSGARRRAVLGAAGSVAITLGVLAASRRFLEQGMSLLPTLTEGPGHLMVLGTASAVVAIAALAWSIARGGLPLFGTER
jgi:anti-sigma factor RsiW